MESASHNTRSQGADAHSGAHQTNGEPTGTSHGDPGGTGHGDPSSAHHSDPGGAKAFNLKEFFTPGADSPFAAVHTARLGEEFMLLLREYLRQQAVRPFKALLRWAVFGLLGAVLLLGGLAMLALAGLRALQVETGSAFKGSLSWLPYLITTGGLLLVMLVTFLALNRQTTGKPPDADPSSSKSSNSKSSRKAKTDASQ